MGKPTGRRDRLEGFAQPHVVRQDRPPSRRQKRNAFDLIGIKPRLHSRQPAVRLQDLFPDIGGAPRLSGILGAALDVASNIVADPHLRFVANAPGEAMKRLDDRLTQSISPVEKRLQTSLDLLGKFGGHLNPNLRGFGDVLVQIHEGVLRVRDVGSPLVDALLFADLVQHRLDVFARPQPIVREIGTLAVVGAPSQ